MPRFLSRSQGRHVRPAKPRCSPARGRTPLVRGPDGGGSWGGSGAGAWSNGGRCLVGALRYQACGDRSRSTGMPSTARSENFEAVDVARRCAAGIASAASSAKVSMCNCRTCCGDRKKTNARGLVGGNRSRVCLGQHVTARHGFPSSHGVNMSRSSREREAWTKFVEQREERETKAKRPRARKSPQPSPEELEAALDDLVGEGERLDTRGNSPMDT